MINKTIFLPHIHGHALLLSRHQDPLVVKLATGDYMLDGHYLDVDSKAELITAIRSTMVKIDNYLDKPIFDRQFPLSKMASLLETFTFLEQVLATHGLHSVEFGAGTREKREVTLANYRDQATRKFIRKIRAEYKHGKT